MSNSYKYIDPDYTYTDPKTGVFKNLVGITNPDDLLFVESGAVIKRLKELYEKPIEIKGVESLFAIHSCNPFPIRQNFCSNFDESTRVLRFDPDNYRQNFTYHRNFSK